jgi:cobalt-precorrin-5B (C1)-methyltransferase
VKKAPPKKLRSGFTTGAAAAAAVKGALRMLVDSERPENVRIQAITGENLNICIHSCEKIHSNSARCTVIKDAGDDPDITHKAEIGAVVTLSAGDGDILIHAGTGVGTVTKPGLEIPPGEPAINPGPREMIRRAVTDVFPDPASQPTVAVEVFVPEGEKLARNTLNPRLGIVGGISILGTTGIVRPMSHEAYIATIEASLSVARAMELERVVLTTGRRSERFAQGLWPELPEEAFVQIGDFFKASIDAARRERIAGATLSVFFGKAVKMAQGVPHTHAAKSAMALSRLAAWTREITGDAGFADDIAAANTARHAFDLIMERYPKMIAHVGERMTEAARNFAGPGLRVRSVILDYAGNALFDSDNPNNPSDLERRSK